MSMIQLNHMSLMVPSPFGGCSMTIWPLAEINNTEVVDGVSVGREEERLAIHQLGEVDDAIVLSPDALEALSDRNADAPRKVLLYAFRARVKSSVSRTFSAVSRVGTPSLNSTVPMRISTFSDVVMNGGSSAAAWAVALPALKSVAPISVL
jgi:hypothetical protein